MTRIDILPQLDVGTLQESVYAELKRALISGRFTPGDTLTMRDLAEQFGTSPMPVREALHRLVSEHALEFAGKRTLRVPLVSVATMHELSDVRCLLEGEAAGLAATRRSDDELSAIGKTNDLFRQAVASGDVAGVIEHNRSFHFQIYAAARSRVLMRAIEPLWLQSGPYVAFAYAREEGRMKVDLRHHEGLIRSLRKKDSEAAARFMRADLRAAEAEYCIHIENALVRPRRSKRGGAKQTAGSRA